MPSIAQTEQHDNTNPLTRAHIRFLVERLGDSAFNINGRPHVEYDAWIALDPDDQVRLVYYAGVVAELLAEVDQ